MNQSAQESWSPIVSHSPIICEALPCCIKQPSLDHEKSCGCSETLTCQFRKCRKMCIYKCKHKWVSIVSSTSGNALLISFFSTCVEGHAVLLQHPEIFGGGQSQPNWSKGHEAGGLREWADIIWICPQIRKNNKWENFENHLNSEKSRWTDRGQIRKSSIQKWQVEFEKPKA